MQRQFHRVRIDDEVFALLQREAIPLVDEPNDVLRRLLGLREEDSGVSSKSAEGRKRLASRHLLPIKEFRLPILTSVATRGEAASRKDILEDVYSQLESKLSHYDLEETKQGKARWTSRAEFVAHLLRKEGSLESAGRGMWRITDEGRKKVGEVL